MAGIPSSPSTWPPPSSSRLWPASPDIRFDNHRTWRTVIRVRSTSNLPRPGGSPMSIITRAEPDVTDGQGPVAGPTRCSSRSWPCRSVSRAHPRRSTACTPSAGASRRSRPPWSSRSTPLAALGAVLVAGQASDRFGRKPLLVGAAVGMLVGLVVFMTADGLAALFVGAVHPRRLGRHRGRRRQRRPARPAPRAGRPHRAPHRDLLQRRHRGDHPQRRAACPVRAGPARDAVRRRRRGRPRAAARACWR